ncbi:hypothetical protein ACFFQW_35090 [Umezawaea endophytica]|uniref:Uncharacterized protein n=1 Tax=Umezawaea endophytica TaxID=1654476 RepID=A0A9X3A6U2_9PSEU|nr:hypothetical protein [Umezawaea endophytica]MCS7483733.1 hypothetical protein [Umezawaea endophytica]
MNDKDQAWTVRLEKMFPTIEQWGARIRSANVTVPAPDSSLARDDRFYPAMPASQLAYGALATAVEHPDFFRVAFQGTQTLYPTAYFTVLRSALMGGAQAVWVLKPPRVARLENALRLARDDIKQRSALLSDDVPTALGFAEQIATARQALRQELGDVQAAAATLELDPVQVRDWRLNMTNVIKSVAGMIRGEDGEDPALETGSGLPAGFRGPDGLYR